MPRNPNAGPSALRNRNRVTNKTRLKVIHGNIDADPHVLDEDEEKARVVSTAGVEAEDANVRRFFPPQSPFHPSLASGAWPHLIGCCSWESNPRFADIISFLFRNTIFRPSSRPLHRGTRTNGPLELAATRRRRHLPRTSLLQTQMVW